MVTFLPRWPHTCRYALSPILACPLLLAVQTLYHTRLQIYYDSLWHGARTSSHSRLFFAGHQGGFVQLGIALPISHDTTYLQVFLLLCGHGLLVFLEDAVSILDLSVLVVAGNFLLQCHSGNSSFHHLLGRDFPSSWSLCDPSLSHCIVHRYFLSLIGSLR